MKIPRLLVLILAFASPLTGVAQLGGGGGAVNARSAAEAGGDLKRFDLNFPGGTPDQFVAAISTALQEPLNAIIPNDQKNAKIMPMKVFAVTVPELFSALESASSAERPIVTSMGLNGARNVQFRNVAMGFRPNVSNVTNTTVWSFYSTEPTQEYLDLIGGAKPAEQVCQYFQLAPYLGDHSIEDITTAIQTGWKMLKISPMPQLSFHEETKLLIAVGLPAQIAQIPQVLEQLQQDNTAAIERISKLQASLAEVEAKKEVGWEKKAEELSDAIARAMGEQKARGEKRSNPSVRPNRIQTTR